MFTNLQTILLLTILFWKGLGVVVEKDVAYPIRKKNGDGDAEMLDRIQTKLCEDNKTDIKRQLALMYFSLQKPMKYLLQHEIEDDSGSVRSQLMIYKKQQLEKYNASKERVPEVTKEQPIPTNEIAKQVSFNDKVESSIVQRRINDLSKQLQESKSLNLLYEQDELRYRRDLKDLQSQLHSTDQEMDLIKKWTTGIQCQQQYREKETELEESHTKVEVLKSEIIVHQQKFDELDEKVNGLERQLHSADQEMDTIRSLEIQCKQEFQEKKDELEESHTKVEVLKKEMSVNQQKFNELDEKVNGLERQLHSTDQEMDTIKSSGIQCQQQYREKETELEESHTKVEVLKREHRVNQQKFNELDEKVNQITYDKSSLEKDIQHVSRKLQESTDELKTADSEVKSLSERIKGFDENGLVTSNDRLTLAIKIMVPLGAMLLVMFIISLTFALKQKTKYESMVQDLHQGQLKMTLEGFDPKSAEYRISQDSSISEMLKSKGRSDLVPPTNKRTLPNLIKEGEYAYDHKPFERITEEIATSDTECTSPSMERLKEEFAETLYRRSS